MVLQIFSVATALAIVVASAAHAASVTYTGSVDGTDLAVTITDSDPTYSGLVFNVTSTANPNPADLYALGFMWDGSPEPAPTWDTGDFNTIGSNTGEAITNVCASCSDAGNGANFNGTGTMFDYIVRMGDQGLSSSGYLTAFSFYVDTTLSLAEALGDTFGIRGQSSRFTGEGSFKYVDFELSEVPLPAAGWMMLAGLGGLAALRRRKKAA